ncbi:HNH endonuclease [Polaribacter phage Freya_1]|uniref:HNH endonuclease n=2 Tax=Freyavirus TaxID=2948713 RepID=A0A8E4ZJH8_9CAUD|nr:HNH endonuclease [Polaribacter phage Danklef_1]YP_010356691.1 HNH endonuclease [Polaribacter phage Freya_1]QQV90627.1 HNH endonuclease [Polaribacter phage Danklef_2]QQV90704.1 HNH endonuclease [Polaribacter phage Danklef_3]QQV90781.1 HNH endonuclease [Polaribacter phage Danklef_4]QQV90859.1 HNH endonuclease [Polaribacter phage Danklef_5]QQV90939.1 HNH endonuclease [Polaribacter phage Freya_2]QQV91007.1 HNH endonuclease [Polaribacter phage Freya_3]QQV91075.1 HNH endonuclease [Polaribacter
MPKGYFTQFTKDQEDKIKDEFLLKPVKRLADEVGCTYGRIMRFLKKNDLEIPRELIEKRKLESRKKKGDVAYNKGLKQPEYMSKESIEKTKKTRFKKGQLPKNTLKVGSERLTKDGYIELKIADPNKWILKQRYIYETYHKVKLKKGEIVVFIDGNNRNFTPVNLEKITKSENMNRNSIHRYPKEVKQNIILLAKVRKTLRENGIRD